MKRLRASEQGDPEAPGLAAGAAANPDTPGGAPAPPASIQAPSEKLPDTQTAISALSLPSAARPEEQPPARSLKPSTTCTAILCNIDTEVEQQQDIDLPTCGMDQGEGKDHGEDHPFVGIIVETGLAAEIVPCLILEVEMG
ncbi:CaM kinase-like vesicle-associated protein [Liparis tanakae]|uniref:CaM kinase-like vesicle-associated protein n=1 Tax=Liparis tanakae TaxID=230148 RepID=A0A4Z2J3J1_9TELE|nr:CaM kinase-like vesicle-associated protein [Liparis tanakae]